MAMLADLVISGWRWLQTSPARSCCLLSLLLPIFADATFDRYPMAVRWTAAAVLYALPVLPHDLLHSAGQSDIAQGPPSEPTCAVRFSEELLEYLSMILGLRAVAMLALVIYLLAGLYARRDRRLVPAG